jgi:hypothetical protein
MFEARDIHKLVEPTPPSKAIISLDYLQVHLELLPYNQGKSKNASLLLFTTVLKHR